MTSNAINVGRDFSRYPAGRYKSDGPYNGEKFREEFLLPALRGGAEKVVVEFNDARGYGSSFLEEAFGGLVRAGFDAQDLFNRLDMRSNDKSLIEEIKTYITDQSNKSAT
jgi:hypothetical protein